MMTALSDISGSRRSLLSKVVLPLPRKPVITETGRRLADLSSSNTLMTRYLHRKIVVETNLNTRDDVAHPGGARCQDETHAGPKKGEAHHGSGHRVAESRSSELPQDRRARRRGSVRRDKPRLLGHG